MKRALAFAALGFTALLGGCNRPYLTWTPREPLAARRGHVQVIVEDRRADRALLGRAFGWGGARMEIRVRGDEVQARVERLTKEAVVTAGLGLGATAEPPTGRLLIDVDAIECDGTSWHARASLSVRVAVAAPDGMMRVSPIVIDGKGEGRGCQLAFAGALDVLLDELAARLVEGPVHDAVLGGATPETI
jgi:hypothetical protein